MSVFTNEEVVTGDVSISSGVNVNNFPATQPISGTVSVGNFPAIQNVAVTSSVEVEVKNDAGNPIPVTSGSIASAAITSNAVGAASAVTLLTSRAARSKFIIFNETGTLCVKLGSGASASDYSMRLPANTSWEFSGYSGQVTAIKVSGTTNVQTTDI